MQVRTFTKLNVTQEIFYHLRRSHIGQAIFTARKMVESVTNRSNFFTSEA